MAEITKQIHSTRIVSDLNFVPIQTKSAFGQRNIFYQASLV